VFAKDIEEGINATDGEIMKVVDDFLEDVMDRVVAGKKVVLNKYSYIQVVGRPITENKAYMTLAKQGLAIGRNGVRKIAKISRRKDFVYKIEYVNTISKEKIYFEPHPDFSARVHKALEETNTYFDTKTCNEFSVGEKITKNCNYD
jgi:hypothetical protein